MIDQEFNALLDFILNRPEKISDINFSPGRLPQAEINGQLAELPVKGMTKLSAYQTEQIAMTLMRNDKENIRKLLKNGSVDLSYSIPGKTRFRVNIFSQRGTYATVMRVIPNGIPSAEELGLPQAAHEIPKERNGIVLVTGPTGSGKSTTLAAIIRKINETRAYHIVTIEDPIEYLHPHLKSTVNQREVGPDAANFAVALRAALRQAPKVILVGEMRDHETTSIALEAAETGHLVFSTLHTIDASKTIERIIGIFPKNEEQQIRTRLAQSFRWILSQRLVPRADGKGRVAVIEVLRSTQRTREYIQEGEKEGGTLLDAMYDGSLDHMQSFDGELERLCRAGTITRETALSYATNSGNLELALSGIGGRGSSGGGETPPPAGGGKSGGPEMAGMME